jgi:hypothetical protein
VPKPETKIGLYTPAGYPRENPKFREEAERVLERGKKARAEYEKYVREWSAKLRAGSTRPQE